MIHALRTMPEQAGMTMMTTMAMEQAADHFQEDQVMMTMMTTLRPQAIEHHLGRQRPSLHLLLCSSTVSAIRAAKMAPDLFSPRPKSKQSSSLLGRIFYILHIIYILLLYCFWSIFLFLHIIYIN